MIAIPIDKPEKADGIGINFHFEDGHIETHIIGIEEIIDIVRCGECKWSYTDERDGTLWCKVHMSHYRVNSDAFCSYGERK